MESILCTNIPIQVISCTDTDGKITPMRFRFQDKTGTLTTIQISRVLKSEQKTNHFHASFTCEAEVSGIKKVFELHYNYSAHAWSLNRIEL